MFSKNATAQAMLLMLASMFCFAAMNIVISALSHSMLSGQMVLVRNIISLAIVLCVAGYGQRRFPRFTTQRMWGHIGRGAVGGLAMQLWFHSVTVMPVTLATALSFTTPIFATIFAILFLGERAGVRRWSAMGVSFIGVLMILRPDLGAVDPNVGFVLASSAAMALAGIFVKSLSRTEAPETIVFYMGLVMIPLAMPMGIAQWQPIQPIQWVMLTAIAALSTFAQIMMAHAFKRAEMVALLPLDFTRLIFTSVLAYLCFGEMLDHHAWLGAGVIMASTLYIAHREARRKKMR